MCVRKNKTKRESVHYISKCDFHIVVVNHETYFGTLEISKIAKPETMKDTISVINNLQCIKKIHFLKKNLRDTRVKVVFPFPKSGLLCKEIITLRLLPHVIKGHTFSYRPSSHLKDLIQQT